MSRPAVLVGSPGTLVVVTRRYASMKLIRTAVIAGAFVVASVLGSSPVLAASPIAGDRAAAAGPLCTGYVTANPTYQSDPVNTTATVNVNWYCEGTFHVVANINWGDGNSDNYTCWSNCSSGSTQFNHVYVTRGYFYPYIYMNGSASGSTSVTVYVY
jgi:hypothetical protein